MKIPEGMKQSEFNQLVLNIIEDNQKINDLRWGTVVYTFRLWVAAMVLILIIKIGLLVI